MLAVCPGCRGLAVTADNNLINRIKRRPFADLEYIIRLDLGRTASSPQIDGIDIEVTVLGDNKVAYGGEEYTLAEFTAKNMPRNKRSISGVCQGPKYFTKGGVSLYKLKESFLGGKKNK